MEASAVPPSRRFAASPRVLRLAGDDRLVALVRDGDEAAFEVLYDRYHRSLLSFCRHMLGRAAEAEDAVQQTFISAYADLRRSDKPVALSAWLFTIARNRCLSMLRARRETASLEHVEPESEGLAAELQRREDLRDMLGDIAELPDDQRAALVLAELGDLDHKEIASVVGCPKDKVKALVFQARSSLALSRQARETSCREIREQLSTLRGGSLRRSALRRHLRTCAGCREFRDEVRRQRSAMAVLLPVVPAAGLREAVMTGAGLSAGAGTGAAGVSAAGAGVAGAKLAVLKGVAAAAIIGAGAAGGAAIVQRISHAPAANPSPALHHAVGANAAPTSSSLPASAVSTMPARSAQGDARGSAVRASARSHRATPRGRALSHGRGHRHASAGTLPRRDGPSPAHGHGRGVGRGGGHGPTGAARSHVDGNGQGHAPVGSPKPSSGPSGSRSQPSAPSGGAPAGADPTAAGPSGHGHGKG